MTPATLKATIEAADGAAARGAPGQALRLLLAADPEPIAPDHDHACPHCGGAWSHLDEPCGDPAEPMLCGACEDMTLSANAVTAWAPSSIRSTEPDHSS